MYLIAAVFSSAWSWCSEDGHDSMYTSYFAEAGRGPRGHGAVDRSDRPAQATTPTLDAKTTAERAQGSRQHDSLHPDDKAPVQRSDEKEERADRGGLLNRAPLEAWSWAHWHGVAQLPIEGLPYLPPIVVALTFARIWPRYKSSIKAAELMLRLYISDQATTTAERILQRRVDWAADAEMQWALRFS